MPETSRTGSAQADLDSGLRRDDESAAFDNLY
jgi:hypothetical protein